jgi:Domain of unknown function (DUF6916)
MISRREFVSSACGALAAGLLPAGALATSDPLSAGSVDLSAGLSKAKFAALLHESFYVTTRSSGVLVMQLAELREYPMAEGDRPVENFTLYFYGLASPKLREGLYTVAHGSAGQAMLRLEPVRFTSRRAVYRANCALLA